MRPALRYAVSLVVAAAVTGGVGAVSASRVPILLVGIAQVYAVGTAIALRYPAALRSTEGPNWASGAFAGVLTFGSFSLLYGAAPGPNLAVAVLGWGLAAFGFVAGVVFEREKADRS